MFTKILMASAHGPLLPKCTLQGTIGTSAAARVAQPRSSCRCNSAYSAAPSNAKPQRHTMSTACVCGAKFEACRCIPSTADARSRRSLGCHRPIPRGGRTQAPPPDADESAGCGLLLMGSSHHSIHVSSRVCGVCLGVLPCTHLFFGALSTAQLLLLGFCASYLRKPCAEVTLLDTALCLKPCWMTDC